MALSTEVQDQILEHYGLAAGQPIVVVERTYDIDDPAFDGAIYCGSMYVGRLEGDVVKLDRSGTLPTVIHL